MSFKDLLVHIDDTPVCEHRVNAVLALAERQQARVTAVALALKSTISTYIGIDFPTSLNEAQQEIVRKASESAVAKFRAAAEARGVEHDCEIIECSASKAPAWLSFYARHADMAFLGQPDSSKAGAAFQESILDGVLFDSGRPIYVVPYIGRPDTQKRTAVIAWDGGRKAVRAVNDAIPLLKGRGGDVVVLVINPEQRRNVHGDKPGADIAAHLKRHGLNVRVEIHPSVEVKPDAAILNFLADAGADLLVMGAYSHSRLREKAFGGVTDTILHDMTAPVLMAK